MASGELSQKAAFDADASEMEAIRSGTSSMIAGVRDEIMSGEAEEYGRELPGGRPLSEPGEAGAEALVEASLEVVVLRQKILQERYPFQVDRGALIHQPSQDSFYEFCLATSLAASRPKKAPQQLVRHFEQVVLALLREFLGGDAAGVRFGWPNERDWNNAPTRMRRKVAWMKNCCGFDASEWTFDPAPALDAMRERAKDARIDVVVRRSHGDNRVGGLTILAQCGCGKNDVDESSRKHEELSDEWLRTFFGRQSIPRPLRVFATSQHVVSSEQLYLKQSSANAMILDRVRLCILAARYVQAIQPHRDRIAGLVRSIVTPA